MELPGLVNIKKKLLKMAIDSWFMLIYPAIEWWVSNIFHSYVKVYQRVALTNGGFLKWRYPKNADWLILWKSYKNDDLGVTLFWLSAPLSGNRCKTSRKKSKSQKVFDFSQKVTKSKSCRLFAKGQKIKKVLTFRLFGWFFFAKSQKAPFPN